VYRESDHELVGGANLTDEGGGCATPNSDLTACADHSICDPCPGGFHDLCPASEVGDGDGGM
jgi:hypothetical protein